MQEYVKIRTDKQTTELLNQVSEAIEFAILGSIDNLEIKENFNTVINNQTEFPNFINQLKDQLNNINSKVEKVSEHNLSRTISQNEVSRDIIINKIVTLFEGKDKQEVTLDDIHLLQKEIEKNSKPLADIKDRTISNYNILSERLQRIIASSNESSETLNKVFIELSDIKEQTVIKNNEIMHSINLILSKQDSSLERIKAIETLQNQPWYKKIFK